MPPRTVRKLPAAVAKHETLQPKDWPAPKGYANGIKARGTFVFVGGMVGWDARERFPKGFVPQAKQALENILAVLAEGKAKPQHIVRLTWYVLDMDEYLAARPEIDARRIGVMAISLGGYYAPRAVAFEQRFACAIAWGAQWDYWDVWKRRFDRLDGARKHRRRRHAHGRGVL